MTHSKKTWACGALLALAAGGAVVREGRAAAVPPTPVDVTETEAPLTLHVPPPAALVAVAAPPQTIVREAPRAPRAAVAPVADDGRARAAPAPAAPVDKGKGFPLARHLDAPLCEGIGVRTLSPDGHGGYVASLDRAEDGARAWVTTGDSFDDVQVLFAGRSNELGAAGVWVRSHGEICRAQPAMSALETASVRTKTTDVSHPERQASLPAGVRASRAEDTRSTAAPSSAR